MVTNVFRNSYLRAVSLDLEHLKGHAAEGSCILVRDMAMRRIRTILFFTVLAEIAACHGKHTPMPQAVQPEVKTAPPTPIAEEKEVLGKPSWDPSWDVTVERALPGELLSDDVAKGVRQFCPRFKSLSEVDKRTFWAYVFQALAGAEAGLVPTTDVRHTEPEVAVKDTVTKRMVRSEGLLQLTYMDRDRYNCDFDWDRDRELAEKDPAKTILQPENNLTCGVKIMENQIIVRRKPLVTSGSYWSTLRPGTISYRVFHRQMANVPEVCRVQPSYEAHVERSAAQSLVGASIGQGGTK